MSKLWPFNAGKWSILLKNSIAPVKKPALGVQRGLFDG